ncbi:unnamed protein product [Rotaria sp. Silwood2]|nr:unnamed protein product [Rotaria sp. Silwood2]
MAVHEVEEDTTVTLTVDTPIRDIILLKDNEELKPSEHIKIVQTSPTTIEIQIIKAKPEDEGKYSVMIGKKQQPLVLLKVIPKPITHQTMDIPQTTFNEGETLTIKCQFDSTPEETFEFLINGKPLPPDDRISTTIEDNTYTIVVKGLKPHEDEGVYTLKSDHLILDTPSIKVVSKPKGPEKIETEEIIEVREEAPTEEQKEDIPQRTEETKIQENIVTEEIPQPKETTTTEVQEQKEELAFLTEQPKPTTKEKVTELPVHEVEETSTVTLTIEKPQATKPEDVVLLKDGEQLKPSDHVKVTPTSPTTTEVQIIKVKPEDEGDYTVEVKGVEQPLVRLKVHPKPVIRQEMQLPKVQFNEKETLTIVCQFDGTPEEPFTFLHNEQPIVPDSRVTTTVEDNKYTIVVKDLHPEDEGIYTLKSDHLILDTPSITVVPEEKKPGTETTTVEEEIITVVPQEKQPETVVQEVKEVTQIPEEKKPEEVFETSIREVEENSTLTLTVQLPEGIPRKEIILLKDKQPVKPSKHIKITRTSSTTIEIQIIKAKPDDEGKYTFIIDKKERPIMQLKVIPKPIVHQTMDIPQTTFKEGETLTIKCQFDSTPEEIFEFLRNGKPLKPDDRISTTVDDTTYTIVVKGLRPQEDEGVYTLKSDHLILDTPSITILPEEKKPQTETTTVEEETITITTEQPQTKQVTEEEKPEAKKKPELPVHEVEESSTVTLTIEKPQATKPEDVILLKDGQELKPSDHVKVTPTSPTTTEVQIIKVKPEDEGDYTVEVKGVEQPLVRLKVHPKPVIRQEMQLPKVQFNEKETLTIVCQFDGTPEEPFTFLHNEQPIIPDSRVTTTVEDNKYTIVVKDLHPEDEGVYTLKSDHLILDTPSITVVPEEKKPGTETTTIEEETITIEAPKAPVVEEVVEEIVEEKPKPIVKQPEVSEKPQETVPEAIVEKPTVEEIPKEEEEKTYRSEIELPIVRVPGGDTITIRIPDSKTTVTNAINVYINNQPVTTLHNEDSRITIEKDGETDNYVVVSDAKPEDAGRYTVEFNGKLQPLCMLEVTAPRLKKTEAQIPLKETVVEEVVEEEEEIKPAEIPTYEVVEGNSVNLKLEQPTGTNIEQIFLLQNDKKLEPNTRLTIKPTSPTTIEITLENVKLNDKGTYSIQFGEKPRQKLMILKVLPKPVIHDSLHLPKDVFEEGETLTIQCEFDKKPDETLVWKLNDIPLTQLNDDRVTIETTDDGKSYTLTVKDLRPKQHEGVYKLESSHLVLETSFIRVIENVQEEEQQTTILVEDEETESFQLQRKPKKEIPEQLETVTQETVSEETVQQPSPVIEEVKLKPAEEEKPKPVEEEKPKPVEEEKPKPVEEEKPKPTEEEKPKPVEEEKPKQVEKEKSKPPEEEKPKPAEEEKPKPVEEEKPKPVEEEKPKPVEEEKPKPVEEEKPKPVEEEKPKPVEEEKPKPVEEEKPKPAEVEKPKPVEEEKPKPVEEEKPKPVEEEKPKPAEEEKPKPAEVEKPKPVEEEKPKPVEEEKPKPVEEEKPKPVEEEKPKPTKEEPKPVEEEKPKPTEEEKPIEQEKPKPVEKEQPKPVEEQAQPEPTPVEEEKATPEKPLSEPVPEAQPPAALEAVPETKEIGDEVKPEEQKPKLKFIKDLKPNKTNLLEGDQLIIEGELDSVPTTLRLQINGEPIPDDRVKIDVKEKKIKFTLDNIQLDESGDYTVKANDDVESKPVSIKVNADIPKFVKNLTVNKKQFDAGETLNFDCTLNKPYNQIVWLKDGQPVEQNERIQFSQDGPKLKLTIKDAQPEDHTGTYSLKVKDVESDKVSVTVTKKVPKFVKELKPNKTTLLEGEQLILECELDTTPTSIKLQINGETIPDDRVKTDIKDKKIKFTLDNIQLDESGNFNAKVNDEVESKPVSITVNADIPKFIKNLTINKKQFDAGETLNFECALNKPFNEVVWLKDGQPIEQNERIQFSQDGPKLKLTIKDAQPEDHTGTYSVKVKNVESDKIPVTVSKKVPKFVKELKPNKTTLLEGEQLILECELDMAPTTVQLQINGEKVPDDRVKTEVKDKKIKFTLDNIKLDESGDFSWFCNDEVESKPVSIKVNADIPKFIKNLTINKKQFDLGETLNFECTLNKPFNEIVWLKDGQPIEQDEHISFSTDGPTLKLTVKDAQPSDHTGTYSVQVKNVESDKVPITVTKKVPKFVKDLKPNKTPLTEGEQLILECELDTTPTNVQLQINGEKVPEDRVKTEVKDKKIKFTLDNIKLDESGNFTAKVNDEVESKPVSIKVNADIPKFVKNLTINKKQFDIGETLNFECTLNKPFNEVIWFKDGQPIEEDARISFSADGPKLKLTVKDAQPTDHTGTYSVQVKNVESDKVPITVTKKVPKFIKDLKPNKTPLTEGEQLILECELDTTPTNVQLQINGEKVPEDRVKTEVKDKKIKFTLDNIKLDESGNFTAKVNDEVESKPVSITVNADIPKFVKNLTINKKQFDLGETLNFECTLNKPFNEVVWLKDGQPIEQDEHISFSTDGPKLKLTVKDAQPSDHTGTYSVQVKNVESDKVPVTVTKKVPKFVKDLKPNKTPLTEGEQLILECELDTAPTTVQLQINGEKVPDDRVKTEVKDKKIKFTLDNIKLDESGNFTAKVNDEVESKPVSITVNADIPKFVKNLTINKKQFDIGETLNFECTLNKPFNEVIWFKDGQPIEEDARISFSAEGPKLKLTIKDAQPSDHTGTYSVQVKNVESDKVPITVTKKVPKFVKDLKANKTPLTEGEQLILECELDTTPTTVQLQINGEKVPDDRVKTEVKDKKIKFTLDNIKLDESGDFTAKVNDEVESKPVSIKVNADIPKFIKNLTINKKQFDIGETLNFECTLNKPFNEIVWLKDGQPIEQDEHISFSTDGPKLKLTNVESDKVPITVTKKVPKFVKDLKANKTPLTEGEQLVLECELDMAPSKVELKLNGETVPEDRVKKEVKDKKIKFTLDNVKLDESGDYTVKVNDEVESKPVSVKVNADIPKFIKNLTINKKQFDIGETLNFECTLNKPFNEVVWLKDGQPIEEDARISFSADGPKLKLTVKDAQPTDHTGTYSVQVKNVESDKVPVTVIKKVPKFVKDLKANKTPLTEGEQLVLDCELDMVPSKVELKLNGETIPNDRIKPEIKDKKIKFTLDNIQLNESGDFTVKVNDEVESKPVSIKVIADIPKFVKNLSINKKKFDIGETLNFECTLNKPFDQIVWLKDNEPMEEDAHIQFFVDGPRLKMTIKDAQPSDHTGTYSVRVKDIESDRIPVVVEEKPLTFLNDLKATKPTLNENETLEFSCQLSRPLKPDETIQWYRNEIQIPIEQEYPNEQINLQIPNVDTTMSGDYYLEVSSPNQKKPLRSSIIKITIKSEEIKFLKPLRALKNPLNEDETLILECELDKPTYKSVKFSLNDKPLNEDEDDRIKITQTGNKWQIKITHVKQEIDEGDYTVTINDKLTSPKVKVTIIRPLTFIQDLTVSNSEPIVDETITFQCELSRPLPTDDSKDLSLTLNGKVLSSEQTRRLKVDISSTSPKIVLTLSNVKLTVDQGNYQLKILHPQELQSQTVNVKVRPKPIEVIQPLQSDKENVFEEDTLILSTKLKNVPDNPTIVWLKDNKPISIDNKRIRSIPSRDGQQFKLSIENVKLDQSGTYLLQINDDIITQCDINIKSIPLKTIIPLKVLGTPIVGGNVELQIELNRPNISFIWLKDNVPLENQPSPIKDQTKYRLKLSDLKLDDSGIYSINFNDGELKESINLTVALPPFEFIEQLKCIPSDDIEEDSNVIMQCVLNRPIDDENIPVTLLKNNKPLSAADNARVKIERDGPTLKIHLSNVKSDDAGVYKVTVDKTKDTSVRLKVHDKPLSIVEQLHLVDAKDNNNTVSENLPFELFIRYNKPVKNVVLNRDNKRVPIDKHTQIIYEDNSTSVRIRFDAAQPDDKGKYETVVKDSTVTNKDGLRSQSVTIIVKPLPVLFTSDIQVSTPDINNIPEKTELTLTTTINQEKGKIKWFLNNKEIKEDQNHKIIVKNLQRQLIIKSTLIADSGIYSAKSDDDERTIELTIKEEIRFTKELTPSSINTIEGKEKELAFECETSKSTTVQWFHDQQKLSPNELKKHYQIESLKNNTLHKLRILQPVTADSGLYRCVLPANIETNSQCTIEPAGVDFLQHLTTPVHVEYMKSALLECELSKRPQNVIWKDKNGKIIEDSDKYEIMNNGKLQGLVINDCDENDNGQYTITIDNNKSSTAEVIVEPHEEKVRSPSPKLESQEPIKAGFRKLLPNK